MAGGVVVWGAYQKKEKKEGGDYEVGVSGAAKISRDGSQGTDEHFLSSPLLSPHLSPHLSPLLPVWLGAGQLALRVRGWSRSLARRYSVYLRC